MRHRFLTLMIAAAVVITVTSMPAAAQTRPAAPATKAPAAKAPAAKAYAAPKTSWGDPDLQGTWTSDDCIGTPMSRPANLGDKLYYTEQELADREAAIARQAENDKQEFVGSNARVSVNPPGHWG